MNKTLTWAQISHRAWRSLRNSKYKRQENPSRTKNHMCSIQWTRTFNGNVSNEVKTSKMLNNPTTKLTTIWPSLARSLSPLRPNTLILKGKSEAVTKNSKPDTTRYARSLTICLSPITTTMSPITYNTQHSLRAALVIWFKTNRHV